MILLEMMLELVIGVMVMEVDKMADEVTDMEVYKVTDMKIPIDVTLAIGDTYRDDVRSGVKLGIVLKLEIKIQLRLNIISFSSSKAVWFRLLHTQQNSQQCVYFFLISKFHTFLRSKEHSRFLKKFFL